MNGYCRIYCVGGTRQKTQKQGIHPLLMQILVGQSNYQWLEPRYMDQSIGPLGQIRVLFPEKPDHPHSLIDACITFFPDYFRQCSFLGAVEKQLQNRFELDFRAGYDSVPEHWPYLREQALPAFRQLHICRADLEPVNVEDWSIESSAD